MSYDEILQKISFDLDSIKNHLKIVPDKFITITDIDAKIENYKEFAVNELGISEATVNNQKSAIRGFLNYSQGTINKETVKEYLELNDSASWKSNQLKALRKCILCGGIYSIYPMTRPKDRCPKCMGLLVP